MSLRLREASAVKFYIWLGPAVLKAAHATTFFSFFLATAACSISNYVVFSLDFRLLCEMMCTAPNDSLSLTSHSRPIHCLSPLIAVKQIHMGV